MSVTADAEILRETQAHACSISRILPGCCLASEVLDKYSLAETQSHSYQTFSIDVGLKDRANDVGGNAEEKLGSGRMDGKSQPDRSAALRILPEPTRSSQGQDAGEGIPSSNVFVLVVRHSWLGTSTASRPRRVPPLMVLSIETAAADLCRVYHGSRVKPHHNPSHSHGIPSMANTRKECREMAVSHTQKPLCCMTITAERTSKTSRVLPVTLALKMNKHAASPWHLQSANPYAPAMICTKAYAIRRAANLGIRMELLGFLHAFAQQTGIKRFHSTCIAF